MKRKLAAIAVLGAAAGILSACNSAEMMYSQGPWGPKHIRRNYPEYSAPWGNRALEPVPDEAIGPAAAMHVPVETGYGQAQVRVYERPLEPDMGPSPFPLEPDAPPVLEKDLSPAAGLVHPPVPSHDAAAPADASPPGVFTPPQRASSYSGTWKAVVGSSSCRIQLSSVPSLDLYKASTQGCSHDAIRGVNGWSFRDNQVILFSRGRVVARLSGAEAALTGKLSGSDAELTMSR